MKPTNQEVDGRKVTERELPAAGGNWIYKKAIVKYLGGNQSTDWLISERDTGTLVAVCREEAHARWICAAVNATAGMNTEVLEGVPLMGDRALEALSAVAFEAATADRLRQGGK